MKKEKLELIEEKRLINLFNIMDDKFENLEKMSVDIDFINTEEFARMLFKIFDKARVDCREKKLKYYANMLIKYSTIEFSKDFYKEDIIEKIGEYPEEHILALNTVYNKHGENNDEKNWILKNKIICVKTK